jgi:hypothetical protein
MFGGCPRQFNLKYIQKIKVDVEENDFFLRGTYIHDRLENHDNSEYAPNDLGMESEEVEKCEKIYNDFINSDLAPKYLNEEIIGNEIEMGLTTKLEPCSFWDDDCLFRGKIDRLNRLSPTSVNAIDWKSGKYREQGNQLKYYAIWCFLKYPELKEVTSSFVFVEANKEYEEVYTKKDIKDVLTEMFKKIKRIEKETIFKANPTHSCQWCDFYKSGDCNPKL